MKTDQLEQSNILKFFVRINIVYSIFSGYFKMATCNWHFILLRTFRNHEKHYDWLNMDKQHIFVCQRFPCAIGKTAQLRLINSNLHNSLADAPQLLADKAHPFRTATVTFAAYYSVRITNPPANSNCKNRWTSVSIVLQATTNDALSSYEQWQ